MIAFIIATILIASVSMGIVNSSVEKDLEHKNINMFEKKIDDIFYKMEISSQSKNNFEIQYSNEMFNSLKDRVIRDKNVTNKDFVLLDKLDFAVSEYIKDNGISNDKIQNSTLDCIDLNLALISLNECNYIKDRNFNFIEFQNGDIKLNIKDDSLKSQILNSKKIDINSSNMALSLKPSFVENSINRAKKRDKLKIKIEKMITNASSVKEIAFISKANMKFAKYRPIVADEINKKIVQKVKNIDADIDMKKEIADNVAIVSAEVAINSSIEIDKNITDFIAISTDSNSVEKYLNVNYKKSDIDLIQVKSKIFKYGGN